MKRTHPVAPLLILLAGCGGEAGPGSSPMVTTDTLPNGTVVTRNPAVGDGDARPLSVDLRIGRAYGDGPDLFGRVADVEVDGYGRIYVLDDIAHEIRVFNADGSHLRTIGGSGNGPTEFSRPTGLAWGPEWQLWIEDTRNNRYSVFDTTGALLATHPRRLSSRGFRWTGSFDREGHLYIENMKFSPERVHRWLTRNDAGLTATDSIPLPHYEQEAYELVEDGVTMAAAMVPFSGRQFWRVAPDGTLWFGITDQYRLFQRAMAGEMLRVVELETDPIAVTAAERDSALDDEFLADMIERGAEVDPARIPAHRPAWKTFTVDELDRLWVIAELESGDSTTLDAFDSEGKHIGRLTLPVRLAASSLLVRAGHIYGVTLDAFDVAYVVRAPFELEPG